MPCEERVRLEREHLEAGIACDEARKRLESKAGVLARGQYRLLLHASKNAADKLESARAALDSHLREHGCGVESS